jgi:hypothetical protein
MKDGRAVGMLALVGLGLWALSRIGKAREEIASAGNEPELLSLTIPRVRSGDKLLAQATVYLPEHPAGSGELESGIPWSGTIDKPVYAITLETEQALDTSGWGAYPQPVLSARLDPDTLTHADGIYKLEGLDGGAVAVGFPAGTYPVIGRIIAYTAIEEWQSPEVFKGWGTTMPALYYKLGEVGALEVL